MTKLGAQTIKEMNSILADKRDVKPSKSAIKRRKSRNHRKHKSAANIESDSISSDDVTSIRSRGVKPSKPRDPSSDTEMKTISKDSSLLKPETF